MIILMDSYKKILQSLRTKFMIIFVIILSLASCFFIAHFAKVVGLVDKPDGIKKVHKGNISLGGGFVYHYSFIFLTFLFFEDHSGISSDSQILIVLSSLSILLMGLWDDYRPLPISIRLIVQVLASWSVILLTDIYVRDLEEIYLV